MPGALLSPFILEENTDNEICCYLPLVILVLFQLKLAYLHYSGQLFKLQKERVKRVKITLQLHAQGLFDVPAVILLSQCANCLWLQSLLLSNDSNLFEDLVYLACRRKLAFKEL